MTHSFGTADTPRPVTTVLRYWYAIERALSVIAFSAIGALIFVDVFGREFVGPVGRALGFEMGATGLFGAQKMGIYALVIGAFTGLGVSVATGSQLVPRVAFGWVPASWGPTVDRLGNLVSGVLFLAVAWYALVFVRSSFEIGTVIPGLEWKAWIIQSVFPVGFTSAGCRYLVFFIWPSTAPVREEIAE